LNKNSFAYLWNKMKTPQKRTTINAVIYLSLLISLIIPKASSAQLSVARRWNEVQLNVIKKDPARPSVQARNLAHISIAMYDAWAVYDNYSEPIFLGKNHGGFAIPFQGTASTENIKEAQEMAISYAAYRMLYNRYQNSPQWITYQRAYCDTYWAELGYDASLTSTDYSDGDPAKLGNYIAQQMIAYGMQDGSNQAANYANQFYLDINPQLFARLNGNPPLDFNYGEVNPNRWQRITIPLALDASVGQPIPVGAPALTPEWGNVTTCALDTSDIIIHNRDGHSWKVYMDPGPPPLMDTTLQSIAYDDGFYKWGYITNIIWQSLHQNNDTLMIDISPASLGNIQETDYPSINNFDEYKIFYNVFDGTTSETGHTINPKTDLAYPPQMVKRGDYTRVMSEYWALGPSSITIPGQWYSILNNITSHAQFEYKWNGQDEVLDTLEFDVRAYSTLGVALLDAAIASWSIKGYYDCPRPIATIRYMCTRGQSSDENLPHYDPAGIPLLPGFIELVMPDDELVGENNENLYKIKLYSWRGPLGDVLSETGTGETGIGWILGEFWWPYQKETFVTPPYQGYVSAHAALGHSAAEVLKRITGDEYFPGGYGEFHAPAKTYLQADAGPSQDIYLQWATYSDAADQCALSQIFGGQHPPQDDIPGRLIGKEIGPRAFDYANSFMESGAPRVVSIDANDSTINESNVGELLQYTIIFSEPMDLLYEPVIDFTEDNALESSLTFYNSTWLNDSTFVVSYTIIGADETLDNVVIQVSAGQDINGKVQIPMLSHALKIDTEAPVALSITPDINSIVDSSLVVNFLNIYVVFSEEMDQMIAPIIDFPVEDASSTCVFNAALSEWADSLTYVAVFDILDANVTLNNIDIESINAKDLAGNLQVASAFANLLQIDTQNPIVNTLLASDETVGDAQVVTGFTLTFIFSEPMDIFTTPTLVYPDGSPESSITYDGDASGWLSPTQYRVVYSNVTDNNQEFNNIVLQLSGAADSKGNIQNPYNAIDAFEVDTKNPFVTSMDYSTDVVSDQNVGLNGFTVTIHLDDDMDENTDGALTFPSDNLAAAGLTFNSGTWITSDTYQATFTVVDSGVELSDIDVLFDGATDNAGNNLASPYSALNAFSVDTKNPQVVFVGTNNSNILAGDIESTFTITTGFDESMDETAFATPVILFPVENPTTVLAIGFPEWLSGTIYQKNYFVMNVQLILPNIDVQITNAKDLAGNLCVLNIATDLFDITTGVGVVEFTEANGLMVYPNPVNRGNDVIAQWQGDAKNVGYVLYNVLGEKVMLQTATYQSGNNLHIQTDNLSTGVYLLQMEMDGQYKVINIQVIR
jgi:Secretion system C-terminal sorting domain